MEYINVKEETKEASTFISLHLHISGDINPEYMCVCICVYIHV